MASVSLHNIKKLYPYANEDKKAEEKEVGESSERRR